ncbi:hypothetical protein SCHPADRAFT_150587 [Schizopora paradoxa]|uniref:Uncharacterized protein n=1 Tax=Schizopora paradoxa TaxID=27342 RepID=A0A0H2S1N5_9AGAM|nr:hypothetical protein SCHPADRAFT_150587 [Schizopora paradoxa]
MKSSCALRAVSFAFLTSLDRAPLRPTSSLPSFLPPLVSPHPHPRPLTAPRSWILLLFGCGLFVRNMEGRGSERRTPFGSSFQRMLRPLPRFLCPDLCPSPLH